MKTETGERRFQHILCICIYSYVSYLDSQKYFLALTKKNFWLTNFNWSPDRGHIQITLLKAQVSLQLGKVFSSDNAVSVSVMYSYMY